MKKLIFIVIVASFSCLELCAPARADGAVSELVQKYLANGRLGEADEQILSLAAAAPNNADAQLGLGLVKSARAFEKLSQSLYRYGFGSKSDGYEMFFGRGLGDVARNGSPEPITYDQFRGILAAFIADLDAADKALAALGEKPAKLKVDLSVARFDWNGDGRVGPEDHIGRAFSKLDEKGGALPFIVGFDTADAKWLQGYDNLLMAAAKAWLSHDFSESWNGSFGVIFPRAVSTLSAANGKGEEDMTMFGVNKAQADDIADFVTLIHTIRWPVTDTAMWCEVRDHLKKVIVLNRETWTLIDKETDDDHEWLPGPKQKSGVLPSFDVTPERIQAWLAVLSQFEAALDGKILVPHWRFNKGINLARIFTEPQPFDLVLWVTGPAALPYLQDGKAMSSGEWNQITNIFEGNFAAYAFYFN
ncbi:hypothetical protein [Rhizobium tumorigenes]|uniref:hypothetical protein n=1 Tax=Rhizobium tumorigenes TaxID=2041385 RepID=UPI0024200E45|nr:hypothetical protein [Rhizobium tumorigenes]WFS03446.1 hypothetical protein PR016_19345 [Rhizobium tumorigenes]